MATGATRDDAAVEAGLGRWVAANPDLVTRWLALATGSAAGTIRLVGVSQAPGGQANETLLVDLGPSHPGVVVRLPALEPTFPQYDLAPQAVVQNAVAATACPRRRRRSSSPTPHGSTHPSLSCRVWWVTSPDRHRSSIPTYDAGPLSDRVMHDELIDVVAAVHAIGWEARGLGATLPGGPLRRTMERWVAYVEWSSEGDPLPALAQALDWCGRHVPAERPPVLLWGDVRLGNLVFDSAGRVPAVLDWDLASLGPREMDLGWHFGLEFMMEALFGGRVPGLPQRGRVTGALRAAQRVRGPRSRLARGLRAGPGPGHQRPPPAHHRRTTPSG